MATSRSQSRSQSRSLHQSRHRPMKKRRLSIQAIFAKDDQREPRTIPLVASPRNYSTLPRSFGARVAAYYDADSLDALVLPAPLSPASPADSFLLDDDPFADLTGGPRAQVAQQDAPSSPPASPLSPTAPQYPPVQHDAHSSPPPPPSTPLTSPGPTRTLSSHTTPAYQRRVFRPRPSLPSLNTLAKMNVVVPKVRPGHVGAGLPYEPWDLDLDASPVANPASANSGTVPSSFAPLAQSPLATSETVDKDNCLIQNEHLYNAIPNSIPPIPSVPPSATMTNVPSPTTLQKPFLSPISVSASTSAHNPISAAPVSSPGTPTSDTFLDLSDSDSDSDEGENTRVTVAPEVALHLSSVSSQVVPASPTAPQQVHVVVAPPVDSHTNEERSISSVQISPSSPQVVHAPPISPHNLTFAPVPDVDANLDHDLDLGDDVRHSLRLDLGLGLNFQHSAHGREEVEPALGRNLSKRLSSRGLSRQAQATSQNSAISVSIPSAAVSPRNSRSSLNTPTEETLSSHQQQESVDTYDTGESEHTRSRSSSSVSSASSNWEHGYDETVLRRRLFRKSSLVGDVLRFAPASPEPVSLLEDMRAKDLLGEIVVERLPAEMAMDEMHRASILSTINDAGHETPSNGEYGLAYGSAVAFPGVGSPERYSPSPERYTSPERYSSIYSTTPSEHRFSPPYSTPSVTSDARSPESSWSEHEGTADFDFGWLPGERRVMSTSTTSASMSDYDSESDAFVDDGEQVRGRWHLFKRGGAPPPPTPVSGVGSAYSDDELASAGDDPGPAFAFAFPSRLSAIEDVEPGTSAGTIRASALRHRSMVSGSEQGEVVDASGWEGAGGQRSGGGGGNWYGGGGGGGGSGRSRSVGRGGDEGYHGGSGWGGGGDDGDDQRGRDGRKSSFSTPSSSDSEEDSDESESDDYGEPSADLAANSASVGRARDGNSDDDVPLARRIPSALVAQRTIRRKVREERNQRRREREELRALQANTGGQAGDGMRSRQTTLRPVGAGKAQSPLEVASSSREAARQAEASRLASIARARQRTQTLPGNGTQSAAVHDLTKKLQNMQSSQADRQHALAINTNAYDTVAEPSRHDHLKSPRVSASTSPPMRHQPLPEGAGRGLRAMRSFHRPKTADALHTHEPLPVDAEARVRRSTTTRRPADDSRLREKEARAQTLPPLAREPPPSNPAPATGPVPSKLVKPPPPPDMRRPSGEMQMRSSGEGLSTPPQTHRHIASKSQGTLTRVFIGDMQRFNMVDIGPTTSAKHILTMVEEQGSLKGWVGTGGWMVWEVAQDFGMERPIRSFELIEDIQASWNKDKTVNTFVLKLTPLAPILSRSNIPSSSPLYSGYVEWEYKRGKWTKRYLRLREHSLWLSKRDNGKDEICLCSLSNFDAYNVTRLHKAPKSFVFAVKSTDNLSFFENTADYLHIFSCNPKDGEKWVEKILLARSYVLFQERNVLFNPKPTGGNASGSAGLSRAAPPRKASGSTPQRTAPQPLVSVDRNDVFAPGSLLSHGQ